jgi:tetratricopeptide (TPR) repeat protein
MKKHLQSSILLLLLACAPLLAQAWAGRGRLQGTVRDPEGRPVEGAKVTLLLEGEEGQGPAPVVTNKKGYWSILGLATGTWHVTIEKPGFKTSAGTSKVISESIGPGTNIPVVLNPIPKNVAEAAAGPSPSALVERGNALLLEKQAAAARAAYQEAVAGIEDPTLHPPILRGIARTYYEEGKAAEAIATLEKALAIAPDDQETLRLIVTLLLAQGKADEAAPHQARIVGEFKVDPNSLLNVGIDRYNRGDLAAAAEYFDRVVREYPELPDGYYYRALVYLNAGKTAEAKADFQKLLALDPDHPKAAEVREFLAAL